MIDTKMSEFGQGLTYCIGLFLAHADRVERYRQNKTMGGFGEMWPELWFNGASDHLFELDISQLGNKGFHEKIKSWAEKVKHWGHGFHKEKPTEKDVEWSIQKAKDFLRQIDEKMLKTKTIKGQWE